MMNNNKNDYHPVPKPVEPQYSNRFSDVEKRSPAPRYQSSNSGGGKYSKGKYGLPNANNYTMLNPPGSGLGTGGLVCGISSILTCLLPCFGTLLGIVGLILSLVSNSKSKQSGMKINGNAKGGLICSIIGIILNIVVTIILVTVFFHLAEYFFEELEMYGSGNYSA